MATADSAPSTTSLTPWEQLKMWGWVLVTVFILSVLVWACIVGKLFLSIFMGIAAFFVIPHAWEIHKNAIALTFWINVVKKSWQVVALIIVYLYLRNNVAYLVNFGMIDSHTALVADGKIGPFEASSLKVLFDWSFAIVMGYTTVRVFYGKKEEVKWARFIIAGSVLVCFAAQIFINTAGQKVVTEAIKPFGQEKLITSVHEDGVLLGFFIKRPFAFLFGEPIVSSNLSRQVGKSGGQQIIFSHTYTDADLGNDSTVEIIDYTKTHVLQGDELVIRTTMPDNADKVKVSSSSGDWIPISKNGEFKMTHNNSPTLGNKGILFSKGQGVKVRVDLVRNS